MGLLRASRDAEGRMSLKDHLLEFRRRLVISALSLVVGTIVGWLIFPEVNKHLKAPFEAYKAANPGTTAQVNYGTATAAFSQQLTISLFVGVIISSPIWLWQIWAFVLPGLTKKEKRISLGFFATTLPLFLAGCAFGYYTLPKAIIILFGFTPDDGTSSNIQQADSYFSFVTRFILAFGATWLLPVFLVGLCAVGLFSGKALLRAWRPAILLIIVAAAIITPTPDPFTMFLMAAPLIVLYFVAVGVCLLIDRRRKNARPDWLDTPEDEAAPLAD